MRITIITQNEPFFLSNNIRYFLKNLPPKFKVISCVISKASPFGKKKSFLEKILETYKIFGFRFFIYYSLRYCSSILLSKSLKNILKSNQVKIIELVGDINSNKSVQIIKEEEPDLLISILGNQIFKKQIFDLAPKGCLNLHTALLPKYRGLMPSFWVLKNNEKKTGVSVFFVDKGIDSGPILVQKEIQIGNMTQAELIRETKLLGMKAIIEAIQLIQDNRVKLIPNPDKDATYLSFPKREDIREFKRAGKRFY
jgi:methionyl-tRNA formyltransferase